MLPMRPVEEAILRTVLYADVFNFPLTPEEVHHFLIADRPATEKQVQDALASDALSDVLEVIDGLIVRKDRQELVAVRQKRDQAAAELWQKAVRYGIWLGRLPFVRMVAITGALAMRNPSDNDDDLDYVLVTTTGRVWLARLFAIAIVKIGKLGGVTVCPNYVLADTALEQNRRDLFIAHEVTQMVPVCGRGVYESMRDVNAWVMTQMPNAGSAFYDETERGPGGFWRGLQRVGEILLGAGIGDRLEAWEYQRKKRRFSTQMRQPESAALLDPQNVKGHFNDHGHPVLRRYQELLSDYNLSENRLPLAGD